MVQLSVFELLVWFATLGLLAIKIKNKKHLEYYECILLSYSVPPTRQR